MEKLIYVTYVDYKNREFLGVIKKIDFQTRTLRKAGIDVTIVAQYGTGITIIENDGSSQVLTNTRGISKRRFITETVGRMLDEGSFDYAFVRFQFFCPNVRRMLKDMKAHGLKVLMEIPTYPYENELRMQGLKGIPKLWCDRMFRAPCTKYIDQIIGSGDEKEIYGVPAFTMRNALCMEDIPLSKYTYSRDRLDILSVSSMLPWHGLDRAIRGIADYYAAGGTREVVLHAVGDGVYRSNYEALAKELGVEDKVIFYGSLFGRELDEVYDKCSVGLCILCAHSKGLQGCTPLKTVEYVGRGLAVVTEMKVWFLEGINDFCMHIPWDDTPLDIEALTHFCDRLMENGEAAARRRIRQVAEQCCDMSVSMRPVVEFYRS